MDELRKEYWSLNNRLSHIDHVIREYIDGRKGDLGLVLDEVRTPAYKALKIERQQIFDKLRTFNAEHVKELHKHYGRNIPQA